MLEIWGRTRHEAETMRPDRCHVYSNMEVMVVVFFPFGLKQEALLGNTVQHKKFFGFFCELSSAPLPSHQNVASHATC